MLAIVEVIAFAGLFAVAVRLWFVLRRTGVAWESWITAGAAVIVFAIVAIGAWSTSSWATRMAWLVASASGSLLLILVALGRNLVLKRIATVVDIQVERNSDAMSTLRTAGWIRVLWGRIGGRQRSR